MPKPVFAYVVDKDLLSAQRTARKGAEDHRFFVQNNVVASRITPSTSRE